ncbi:hypothetical protein [Methylocystis sp. SC2]|uniref:hypothetical protein n=1 Tax=Methylocystis sp. (strain SC2) TaxID=187303 RepID=UPI0003115129|nr:hypothetical protein [Methylocystis sp. SC2]
MMSPDPSPILTSLKTCQDCASRVMDFGLINTRSALQFGQDVWAARSPHDVAEAIVDYGRRQFEYWTEELEEFSSVAGGKKTPDAEVVGLGD